MKGKKCKTYVSPFDMVFDDDNVTQPDVLVVCDPKKITQKNIQGAPDVIFEVLSPSTERKDRFTKKHLYEKFGVKEYILIDVDAKYAEHYILQPENTFNQGDSFGIGDIITIQSLDDLKIPMKEVFENVTDLD